MWVLWEFWAYNLQSYDYDYKKCMGIIGIMTRMWRLKGTKDAAVFVVADVWITCWINPSSICTCLIHPHPRYLQNYYCVNLCQPIYKGILLILQHKMPLNVHLPVTEAGHGASFFVLRHRQQKARGPHPLRWPGEMWRATVPITKFGCHPTMFPFYFPYIQPLHCCLYQCTNMK